MDIEETAITTENDILGVVQKVHDVIEMEESMGGDTKDYNQDRRSTRDHDDKHRVAEVDDRRQKLLGGDESRRNNEVPSKKAEPAKPKRDDTAEVVPVSASVVGDENQKEEGAIDGENTESLEMEYQNDDDAAMMSMMGFGGFDSTKGKAVTGNQEGGVNIKKPRTWRQYMNRRGGFNRPLDKIK
ncbi:hypothetical protein Clacol_006383 [Clathrus columnatus]|uniref:U4/U6.U5 small nuclear ribonucleoprotein 27kDa protein domain-containing protein n=1 Tax=Clathrus columnatus TaxID=1419009 RepID=A0AAV5AEJ0_9AGAM|nr:hypothetical protein Clacol_006383 [Clathrus columnatus]